MQVSGCYTMKSGWHIWRSDDSVEWNSYSDFLQGADNYFTNGTPYRFSVIRKIFQLNEICSLVCNRVALLS